MNSPSTHKARRIARALPSPSSVAMVGLAAAVLIERANMGLLWIALAYALYVTVTSETGAVFDPECQDPQHQHEDCAACGDLPPLVPIRSTFQRITRKATSR